jgi:hypothetical protein
LRLTKQLAFSDFATGAVNAVKACTRAVTVNEEDDCVGFILALFHCLIGGDTPNPRSIDNSRHAPARNNEILRISERVYLVGGQAS